MKRNSPLIGIEMEWQWIMGRDEQLNRGAINHAAQSIASGGNEAKECESERRDAPSRMSLGWT